MLRGLIALLGLAATPGVAAKQITPEQAPRAWVVYAEQATRTITGWLNAEAPPGPRLKAALGAPVSSVPDQAAPALEVKLWVERSGRIGRIEAAPLATPVADQDLRDLLVGRRLAAPPRRIRLPLRIALQIEPAPPADPADNPTL